MALRLTLKAPLFTDWTRQYVTLTLDGVAPGAPLTLQVNGEPADFQYTGEANEPGAQIVTPLAFAEGEDKVLEFLPATASNTDLEAHPIQLDEAAAIGVEGREIEIPAPALAATDAPGPFQAFAGFPLQSTIHCEQPLLAARLEQTNDGPLFIDYRLAYEFDCDRGCSWRFRCYRHDPYIEVRERFSLGLDGAWRWTLNPEDAFDSILSHRGPEFESEAQPVVEPLRQERPRDVLCRLQMPVLGGYFIPNNRGWWAFIDSRNEQRGMLGVMGLYGARWERPVENMPTVLGADGAAEWRASLASGARHWLLYAGPLEKEYALDRRQVFHRLHAEFNALRLDEHLDLTGDAVFDGSCWEAPGMFVGRDFHEQARQRCEQLPALQKARDGMDQWSKDNEGGHTPVFRALLDPTPAKQQAVYNAMIARFEKWVRQFQGYRTAERDYQKSVIGFSRWLRAMLMAYEMLRKDGCLTDEQVGRLNAYFVFAARRIADEGRWPHSRSYLHPDHPESARDFYTYPGEHKPDRLVWSNSLPNFQSDPICALAHISAVFPDHPDANAWRTMALDDLDRQLTAYTGASGAWEESINYAHYTFSYFVTTFRVLKQRLGIDYFNDERVRRFAAWLCRYFGPIDKRFNAYTWPGVGNARVPTMSSHYLLAYAGELADDDPLRADCLAIYQRQAKGIVASESYPPVLAAMAPTLDREYPLRPLHSEHMAELGVAMRHHHPSPTESYLFQKIGFWKDHYENDETAFNWYAKGAPLCMEYGTYTPDIAAGGAHNLVEIPDMDPLRRGYLAQHLLSPVIDYTHCEQPVTVKLLWGRVREFSEIDNTRVAREKTPFFYIGDENPIGPKLWKTRLLMFVKPDYLAVFDRVYGDVPHRYNLHAVADGFERQDSMLTAKGRFELDLACFVQHPDDFEIETGEITPISRRGPDDPEWTEHRQSYLRLYNRDDGVYRTVLFAKERQREVEFEPVGASGVMVRTDEYTDYVFLHNEDVRVARDDVVFRGRSGWIRRYASGKIQACMAAGDLIQAFDKRFEGRGPWTYNLDDNEEVTIADGPPREIAVADAPDGTGQAGGR